MNTLAQAQEKWREWCRRIQNETTVNDSESIADRQART